MEGATAHGRDGAGEGGALTNEAAPEGAAPFCLPWYRVQRVAWVWPDSV